MKKEVKSCQPVEKLSEYKITTQECWDLYQDHDINKLDWNEAGISPSPKIIKALTQFINNSPLNWYPDVEARALRKALSDYTKIPSSQIQVFNGSDSALEYIARTFIDNGDEVIIRIPTYDNFRVYAESCGAVIKPVMCPTPFSINETDIIKAITPKTKIIYLVNPDNPTGATYSQAQIKKILEAAPNALVIVDEAYFEFYGKTATNLIEEYSNIIVSRSFSKAFALAGLRCGYILAQEELINHINKIRVGKNVNSLAQLAAITAIEDIQYTKNYVKEVMEAKKETLKGLKEIGFDPIDTPANFILIKTDSPKDLIEHLRINHFYVRDRSYLTGMENFIRITIGTKQQMEKFVDLVRQYSLVSARAEIF